LIARDEYGIEYRLDIPSFLEYYSGIFTKAALERITGINQKQLGHYVSGYRNPSKKTIERIDNALHRFSDDLSRMRLSV
jgi:transcriptional regulator with XRE-family HTH domain